MILLLDPGTFAYSRNVIVTFEKERDANKKAFDKVRKFTDEVLRERDLVRKDLQRATRTQLVTINQFKNYDSSFTIENK